MNYFNKSIRWDIPKPYDEASSLKACDILERYIADVRATAKITHVRGEIKYMSYYAFAYATGKDLRDLPAPKIRRPKSYETIPSLTLKSVKRSV